MNRYMKKITVTIFLFAFLFSANVFANKAALSLIRKEALPLINRVALYDSGFAGLIDANIEKRFLPIFAAVGAAAKNRVLTDVLAGRLNNTYSTVLSEKDIASMARELELGDVPQLIGDEFTLQMAFKSLDLSLGVALEAAIGIDSGVDDAVELMVAAYYSNVISLIKSALWVVENSSADPLQKLEMYAISMHMLSFALNPEKINAKITEGAEVFIMTNVNASHQKIEGLYGISPEGYAIEETHEWVKMAQHEARNFIANAEELVFTKATGESDAILAAHIVDSISDELAMSLLTIFRSMGTKKREEAKEIFVSTIRSLAKVLKFLGVEIDPTIKLKPMEFLKQFNGQRTGIDLIRRKKGNRPF